MKSIIISTVFLSLLIYCSDFSYSKSSVPADSVKTQYNGCPETDSINVIIPKYINHYFIPPQLHDYRETTGSEDTIFWVYPNDSTYNIPVIRHQGKDVIMHGYKPKFFGKLINFYEMTDSKYQDTIVSSSHVRDDYMIRVIIYYYCDGKVARSLFIADEFYFFAKEGDKISVARNKLLTREIKKVFKGYRLHVQENDEND